MFPWLTAALVLPLVGAAVVALLPKGRTDAAKAVALAFSLAVLGLVVAMSLTFDVPAAGEYQFAEEVSWIPQLGVTYALAVDGIALSMVALTAVLVPVCLLASWRELGPAAAGQVDRGFLALVLVLEALVIGVFAARDLFLFYVFFEVMLVPMYFLIGRYGGPRRREAATTFLVYSLAGGLVMLAAVIGTYVVGPGGADGFLLANLTNLEVSTETGRWLFLGLFVAFAVKAPLWPVHTWLPDAAAQAPPGAAVLLVGVLDKVGTFGMLTILLPLFPEASVWAAPVVVVLALVSILYGAFVALAQRDVLRLIAWTSISHFGFIVLGIFAFTTAGQSGAALYQVNHGFSTAALFLVAGMLATRRGSSLIADFGGGQRVMPLLAGAFLVAGLSSLALPGLSSFVSEFLVLVGTFERYQWAAVIATGGIILAALYILWTYQRMMTGTTVPALAALESDPRRDMRGREAFVVAPLLAVIIALGFYPKPVLDILTPAVDRTMEQTGMTDPAPLFEAEGADQ
ncbi:NADH-quinone oxidoreductase subunit M [Aquipuribacter nitratireducens]|uniref:NADH-quinone oxidoreductase subunit M n=1 Tax=Aquipuribacter nitratireducens TaxID=650104 RepID=A0ABW0GMA2_9MICO